MNFGAESPTERPKASRCWTCLTADTAEVGSSPAYRMLVSTDDTAINEMDVPVELSLAICLLLWD